MATMELTKENLQATVEQNDTVLIDFWAEWCAPCKMFGPIFEKASEKYPDIVFAKCDTEAQSEVAAAFGIQSIPTLAVFREGMLIFKQPGALPAAALEELIQKVGELDMAELRREAGLPPREEKPATAPGQKADPASPPPALATSPAPVAARAPQEDRGKIVATVSAGQGLALLADDFVLRRQGVTREFLERAGQIPSAARVLERYRHIRDALREQGGDARPGLRAEYDAWDFDREGELATLDADTRSEVKAVLRAIDELLK